MIITIITINFHPQQFGIAPFATELAIVLAEKGDVVNVITAIPFDQNFDKIDTNDYSEMECKNLNIVRVPIYLFNKSSFRNRVLFDTSFFISILIKVRKYYKESHRIVIMAPPLQNGLLGIFFKYLYKKDFIFYVQDIVPDLPAKLGIIKNKFLLNPLYRLEKFIYSNAMKVITISPGMVQNIETKLKSSNNKVFEVSNWADIVKISKKGSRPKLSSIGLDKKIVALYAGSFGRKQGFLDSIPILKIVDEYVKKIHFLFIGGGPEKNGFISKLEKANISNFTVLPPMPKEEVNHWEIESDFVFISQNYNIINELFPSKIVSALSKGKPVLCIANKDSELAKIIVDINCGVVWDLRNANAETIKDYLIKNFNKNNLENYSINAMNYAKQKFNKKVLLTKLTDLIRD